MIKHTFYIALFSLCIITPSTHLQAAPIYNVQAGLLVGIQNIEINGSAYDVSFIDGVLENEFNLADPFLFDGSAANDASLALLNAMSDVSEGNFDTQPTLTRGCAGDNCVIHTPFVYEFGYVSTHWFRNAMQELDDERGTADLTADFNSSGLAVVYADWQVSAVPVPAALWLFISGLLALGFTLRRQ